MPNRESHHILTVLRYRSEEVLCLLDGFGLEARAKILASSGSKQKSQVACQILEKKFHPLPRIKYTLFLSPPKKIENFRTIIRQSMELGAWKIVPVISKRCEAKPGPNCLEKLRGDAQESCKQSGNPFLPKILPFVDLESALKQVTEGGVVGCVPSLGSDGGDTFEIHEIIKIIKNFTESKKERFGIWIGPEGGFTEEETDRIISNNNRPIVLSPWTLKVGTAVCGSLALLNFLFQFFDEPKTGFISA